MEISLQAGELVGVLYDALLKQYADPEAEETLKSLNALCVRLVFCLYAEDAGIFGKHGMFHDYLQAHRAEDRRALINLFHVLDQNRNSETVIWMKIWRRFPTSTAACLPMRTSKFHAWVMKSSICC